MSNDKRWLAYKRWLAAASLATVATATRPLAAESLVTFDAIPRIAAPSYVEAGVTFTAVGGGRLGGGLGPNRSRCLIEMSSPKREFRADLAVAAELVSVELGDFADDEDELFLEGFDATGRSLGIATQALAATFRGMRTLTVSAPAIAAVVFGARGPSVHGSSVYADNLRYRPVPEPSALATALPGLLAVCLAASRGRGGAEGSASRPPRRHRD